MIQKLQLLARIGWEPFRSVRLSGRLPWVGAGILVAILLAALLSPLSGYPVGADADPNALSQGPGVAHWLGTDHLGRDLFWRWLLASRAFVGPGVLAVGVALGFGVPAGALAGFYGGWMTAPIRFVFTVLASIPRFVLVLLVCTIYGNNLWIFAAVAGVAYAPTVGEAVRARVEDLRGADYVLANRAHGLSDLWILWVHLVLAACGRLIARHALAVFAFFLVLEATLSYIEGVGVQEPVPSWGNMLAFEWGHAGWLGMLLPAAAIWGAVAALGWLSDGLGEESRRRA